MAVMAPSITLSLGMPSLPGIARKNRKIAARVAWAGAGINLGTGRPSASQIRGAVRAVLTKPQYCERAQSRPAAARHRPARVRLWRKADVYRNVDVS